VGFKLGMPAAGSPLCGSISASRCVVGAAAHWFQSAASAAWRGLWRTLVSIKAVFCHTTYQVWSNPTLMQLCCCVMLCPVWLLQSCELVRVSARNPLLAPLRCALPLRDFANVTIAVTGYKEGVGWTLLMLLLLLCYDKGMTHGILTRAHGFSCIHPFSASRLRACLQPQTYTLPCICLHDWPCSSCILPCSVTLLQSNAPPLRSWWCYWAGPSARPWAASSAQHTSCCRAGARTP
jgi:hypothetical protein